MRTSVALDPTDQWTAPNTDKVIADRRDKDQNQQTMIDRRSVGKIETREPLRSGFAYAELLCKDPSNRKAENG